MELKRSVSIADIELAHPYLVDERYFHASHADWLEVRKQWIAFATLVQEGDEIWEYEDIRVDLGFPSGGGGFLIKRGETIVQQYATYAVG